MANRQCYKTSKYGVQIGTQCALAPILRELTSFSREAVGLLHDSNLHIEAVALGAVVTRAEAALKEE